MGRLSEGYIDLGKVLKPGRAWEETGKSVNRHLETIALERTCEVLKFPDT